MKDVMLWLGAGQIGMAIARRAGFNQKIIVGDKNVDNANNIAKIMREAGFDIESVECDLSNRDSILKFIKKGQEYGEIATLINAAGVSPSQAPIETILKVDLYGTAVLLMGHESLETTRVYLRRTSTEQQYIVNKYIDW